MADPIKGVKLDITLTTILLCWHYSNLIKPTKGGWNKKPSQAEGLKVSIKRLFFHLRHSCTFLYLESGVIVYLKDYGFSIFPFKICVTSSNSSLFSTTSSKSQGKPVISLNFSIFKIICVRIII